LHAIRISFGGLLPWRKGNAIFRMRTHAAVHFLCVLVGCDSGGFGSYPDRGPIKLVFTLEPGAAIAGAAMGSVAVTVQDAYGNTVANASTRITVAIGTNAAHGTLSGTTSEAAVSGVASFSNLVLDKSGNGYTLSAEAAGLTGATSSPFDVTSAPRKLAFAVQPNTTVISEAIKPPVQVAVQDEDGNAVTGANTSVTLALGTNPMGGVLSGTATQLAVHGVATFSDLSLDKSGAGYTLTAEAAGLGAATSYPFDAIDPVATVRITPTQSAIDAGAPLMLTVTTLDAAGNVVMGRTVAWTTSDWRVLYQLYDFSGGEAVCGLSTGSATITATSEGQSGTASVTVTGSSSVACCFAGC